MDMDPAIAPPSRPLWRTHRSVLVGLTVMFAVFLVVIGTGRPDPMVSKAELIALYTIFAVAFAAGSTLAIAVVGRWTSRRWIALPISYVTGVIAIPLVGALYSAIK